MVYGESMRFFWRLSHGTDWQEAWGDTDDPAPAYHRTQIRTGSEDSDCLFRLRGSLFDRGIELGKEKQADWYLNLKDHPQARLEVKGKVLSVTAREAQGEIRRRGNSRDRTSPTVSRL